VRQRYDAHFKLDGCEHRQQATNGYDHAVSRAGVLERMGPPHLRTALTLFAGFAVGFVFFAISEGGTIANRSVYFAPTTTSAVAAAVPAAAARVGPLAESTSEPASEASDGLPVSSESELGAQRADSSYDPLDDLGIVCAEGRSAKDCEKQRLRAWQVRHKLHIGSANDHSQVGALCRPAVLRANPIARFTLFF
jgi:hypothetical protein